MRTGMDAIDSTVINAMSPDRSVKARSDATTITVELDGRVLGDHDESSLSTQCVAAVARARTGFARAVATIAGGDEADAVAESPDVARMRERFTAAVEELVTRGTSGPVTVELAGRVRADVRMRPRTVQYLSAQQLAGHINTALAEALRARALPIWDMYARIFDSDESTTVKGH